MARISVSEIKRQYEKVKKRGWLPVFQREAKRVGTSTAHLLGIGSRETNLENIKGDYRNGRWNGFGPLQVDIGTDPEYARTWTSANWQQGVIRGADILIMKLEDVVRCGGRNVMVRKITFTAKKIDAADDLRRIATAAYNCGRWAHYHFSKGQNVDSTTTGKDYSRDVYDRAFEFAKLLEADGLEPNAVKQEIIYQGKYARDRHKQEAGIFYAERVKLPQGEAQESREAAPNEPAEIPQEAETAVNTTPQDVPQSPPSEVKEVTAPAKEDSTATATKLTIAGITVPTFLTAAVSAIQSAIQNGFISAADVGQAVLGFIRDNTKWVLILIGLIIVGLMLRKLWKQITLWLAMWIKSDPKRHDVEVKPQ